LHAGSIVCRAGSVQLLMVPCLLARDGDVYVFDVYVFDVYVFDVYVFDSLALENDGCNSGQFLPVFAVQQKPSTCGARSNPRQKPAKYIQCDTNLKQIVMTKF
jgi:hypothetical protein